MSTRSKTKHNGVNPSAQPSSGGPPIRPPHSIRGNGVTTAPQVYNTLLFNWFNTPVVLKFLIPLALQVVAQVPGNPLSTTTHQTGSTPHIVPKPSSLANHPPTPVVTNQSLHMGSVDVIEHAVQERDVFSDVPSFSLGFTQDGGTSPLRQTTTFATSQQHASVSMSVYVAFSVQLCGIFCAHYWFLCVTMRNFVQLGIVRCVDSPYVPFITLFKLS